MLNVGQNNPKTKIRRKSRTTLSENNDSTYNKSRRQSQVSDEVTEPDRTPVTFDNFSHIIYEKAAVIFAYLKGEPDSFLPTFGDERVKRRSYSLAFGAKKCKQSFYTLAWQHTIVVMEFDEFILNTLLQKIIPDNSNLIECDNTRLPVCWPGNWHSFIKLSILLQLTCHQEILIFLSWHFIQIILNHKPYPS